LGDIEVTALMTDHSAFDSYSFLIKAKGRKNIFYTGDFRLHGPRSGENGEKMLKLYNAYAKNMGGYLICEGTNILKEKVKSEFDLIPEAQKIFKKYKYVFILCSSTNIDRICIFYKTYKKMWKDRPFLCDRYQEDILNVVTNGPRENSSFYHFEPSKAGEENGYCRLIRPRSYGDMERCFKEHRDESVIIYSMWDGYIDKKNNAKNEDLIKFLEPYEDKLERLHTSGHADVESIKKIVNIIKPDCIMPMHTENREEFKKLFPEKNIINDEAEW